MQAGRTKAEKRGNYRVCFDDGQTVFRVCRILYGGDGSFYVSVPYHPEKKAVLFKIQVNYSRLEQLVGYQEAIDLAQYTDDEVRLKYAHHPDGFIQFSGAGVLSGRNDDGSPKGVGIMSWPLTRPIAGPAFTITIRGIEQFDCAKKIESNDIVFSINQLAIASTPHVLFLEGHYFPAAWTRFIPRSDSDAKELMVAHPSGGVITMKALFPPAGCPIQNFLAIEMYAEQNDSEINGCEIIFSGSTGNIRRNEKGEKLGDGIYYMFPYRDIGTSRSVNYRREV